MVFLVAFSAGLAVVLVTRPLLVVLRTLGLSTTAGACFKISIPCPPGVRRQESTTYSSGGLARLGRVSLGPANRLLSSGGGLLGGLGLLGLLGLLSLLGLLGSRLLSSSSLGGSLLWTVLVIVLYQFEMSLIKTYLSSRLGGSFLLGKLHGSGGAWLTTRQLTRPIKQKQDRKMKDANDGSQDTSFHVRSIECRCDMRRQKMRAMD